MSLYNTLYNKIFIKKYLSENKKYFDGLHKPSILDLGCGELPFYDYYSSIFGDIHLCDIERRIPDDSIIIMDAHDLKYCNNKFDCIILSEVLEHLLDPDTAIGEIARVLKNGGLLFLTVPFLHPLHEIPYDFSRFTEFSLQKKFRNHDMEIIVLKRRGNFIVLSITLMEYYLFYFIEIFKLFDRFIPVKLVLKFIFRVIFNFIYLPIILLQLTVKGVAPGENLGGIHSLNTFILGYNLIIKKRG